MSVAYFVNSGWYFTIWLLFYARAKELTVKLYCPGVSAQCILYTRILFLIYQKLYDEDMNELFTFNVSEFKNSMRCMQSILLLYGMPRKIKILSFKGAYYIKAYT